MTETLLTIAERSAELLQNSLQRAQELLDQGRGREAVQETLWLLETITTAFRGLETSAGTVEGNYFNRIVRELEALTQEPPSTAYWNGRRLFMVIFRHRLAGQSDMVSICAMGSNSPRMKRACFAIRFGAICLFC